MLRRLILLALCMLSMSMYLFSACTPADLCSDIECGEHGNCIAGLCVCTDDYTGDNCETPPDPNSSSTGYDSLFIGHSFFIPIARNMDAHALRAGFVDHTQQTFFSGGASGAPQALWENADDRNAIQDILNSGDVELLGMTYHPDYPGIEGYINWVEYALQQNPDTKFFIALPWAPYPANEDVTVYETTWVTGHSQVIHDGHVDTLRSDFPGSDFYCIPYGLGAIELYKLFESGNLSDVQSLISDNGSEAVFSDSFGHPDDILITLGQLIWLKAIYGVDLNSYDYDTGYTSDLKAIAQDIMDSHDPDYNSP